VGNLCPAARLAEIERCLAEDKQKKTKIKYGRPDGDAKILDGVVPSAVESQT